jgi:hypothetical protein
VDEGDEPSADAGPAGRSQPTAAQSTAAQLTAARRRKLDAVFGDVLPETTKDERDQAERNSAKGLGDRWYAENRPPHHG